LTRLGERVRAGGLARPGLVPFGLFLAFALFLATLPLQNAVSRRYEAEADWLALEATHDPKAMVGLQEGFVRTSLADPGPPRFLDGVFDDHPPPLRRIGMALAFRSRAAPGGS